MNCGNCVFNQIFVFFNPFSAVYDVCFEILQFGICDGGGVREAAEVPEIFTFCPESSFPCMLPDEVLFFFGDTESHFNEFFCRDGVCFVGSAFFGHIRRFSVLIILVFSLDFLARCLCASAAMCRME